MRAIIQRLNELQGRSGLSCNEFTRVTGISMSSFTDWNKGKSNPSLDALMKISRYFNVSMDYLCFGNFPNENLNSENAQYMLKNYRNLSPDLQARADSYIDGLLELQKPHSKRLSS